MEKETITVEVEGSPKEEGHIGFRDFLQELDNFSKALSTADRLITGEKKGSLNYRIVDLRRSNPFQVVIDAVNASPQAPGNPERVVGGVVEAMQAIASERELPSWVTSEFLSNLQKFSRPAGTTSGTVRVARNGSSVSVGVDFHDKVQKLLASEDKAKGSIDGRLEKINVHGGANVFDMYPSVGPARVRCHFPIRLEQIAISSVKRWVRVTGELIYKTQDQFPYRIEATNIEVLPLAEDLPSLDDLFGIAPKATGDMKSEEFVRQLRNEWR